MYGGTCIISTRHPARMDAIGPSERRALVYARIVEHPGLHTRLLARDCGLPLTTAKHHIEALERAGRIVGRVDGRYRRLFPVGFDPLDMAVASAMRRKMPSLVLATLATGGSWTRRQIAQSTGVPSSALGGALTHLRRAGLLTRELRGGRFYYMATAPAAVHERASLSSPTARP